MGNREGSAYLNEGLRGGEYYIVIYPTDKDAVYDQYILNVEFTSEDEYEKYPNYSFDHANEINHFNKDYIGNVGNEFSNVHTETKDNKYDYYFFRLTADGNVTVRLSHNNTNEGTASEGWYADLYGNDRITKIGTRLELGNHEGSDYFNEELKAGLYYIKIYPNEDTVYDQYVLRVEFYNDEVCNEKVVYAQNPGTQRWVIFPTSCDVPYNWLISENKPPDFRPYGDIDGNNKIGLEEAINALQIVSDIKTD